MARCDAPPHTGIPGSSSARQLSEVSPMRAASTPPSACVRPLCLAASRIGDRACPERTECGAAQATFPFVGPLVARAAPVAPPACPRPAIPTSLRLPVLGAFSVLSAEPAAPRPFGSRPFLTWEGPTRQCGGGAGSPRSVQMADVAAIGSAVALPLALCCLCACWRTASLAQRADVRLALCASASSSSTRRRRPSPGHPNKNMSDSRMLTDPTGQYGYVPSISLVRGPSDAPRHPPSSADLV